jgi:hypothetical protein
MEDGEKKDKLKGKLNKLVKYPSIYNCVGFFNEKYYK